MSLTLGPAASNVWFLSVAQPVYGISMPHGDVEIFSPADIRWTLTSHRPQTPPPPRYHFSPDINSFPSIKRREQGIPFTNIPKSQHFSLPSASALPASQ